MRAPTVGSVEKPVIEKPTIAPTSLQDDITREQSPKPTAMQMAMGTPELEDLQYNGPTITTTSQYFWPEGGMTIPGGAGGGGRFWPVQGEVTQDFKGNAHKGMDIGVPVGTPVMSPISGTIIGASYIGTWGNQIRVKGPDGSIHLMAHLSGFAARVGQQVQAGQVIAYSGNTGRSTGPHVHWEIWAQGGRSSMMDPMDWVSSGGSSGGGGTSASGGALYSLARQAGFSDSNARIMAAIAMAESSGNPRAYNGNTRTGDQSYGLWQINMLGGMGPERRRLFGISRNEQLFDPRINARAALRIFQQQGFRAWSVYNSGAYRRYL